MPTFLLNMIPGALKSIWDLGSDFINQRRELVKAKHDIKMEAIKSTSDWELAKITEVGGSWKDEFWTIVLAIPAILVMVAPVVEMIMYTQEYHKGDFINAVIGGMMALDKAPDWYTASLLTAISASFGIKGYNHYTANNRKAAATDAIKEMGLKVVAAKAGTKSDDPATSTADSGVWPDLTTKK